MQTIKVNVTTTQDWPTLFSINGHGVADIVYFQGVYSAELRRPIAERNALDELFDSLPEAVEFVGDEISRHFAAFGIDVEFANE